MCTFPFSLYISEENYLVKSISLMSLVVDCTPFPFCHAAGCLLYDFIKLVVVKGQRSGHSEGGDGEWPVRVTDYADHFALLDTDRDGLVNGLDCRGFLMNTNLPQHMLAHAWS